MAALESPGFHVVWHGQERFPFRAFFEVFAADALARRRARDLGLAADRKRSRESRSPTVIRNSPLQRKSGRGACVNCARLTTRRTRGTNNKVALKDESVCTSDAPPVYACTRASARSQQSSHQKTAEVKSGVCCGVSLRGESPGEQVLPGALRRAFPGISSDSNAGAAGRPPTPWAALARGAARTETPRAHSEWTLGRHCAPSGLCRCSSCSCISRRPLGARGLGARVSVRLQNHDDLS